ncbi:MAG TPA: hypothetical protein VM183_12555 [Burkholderiales bacterium]|nr:hypothetical protein [Burkholderiales bacterium]
MSLLWRNKKLRIGLAPDRIYISGAKAVELASNDGSWTAAVESLGTVLASTKGEATVVLADQFVRYTLLPWNETLKSAEQWNALASHRFTTLHGPKAGDWQINVAETAPMGPRLACAVDRSLIERLADAFVKANVRLASVQPFLVAAFNRIRKTVGNGSCWIVVEEPGRLTLALIQRGMWVAIRTRRADKSWRTVLPEMLERESAFLGLSSPITRVVVCAQGEFNTEMYDAWRAEALAYRDLALAAE